MPWALAQGVLNSVTVIPQTRRILKTEKPATANRRPGAASGAARPVVEERAAGKGGAGTRKNRKQVVVLVSVQYRSALAASSCT